MSDEVTTSSGWQPLSEPTNPDPPEPQRRRLNVDGSRIVSPFVRLARTHAFHAAGDASYAVALVGSIFALDTDAARGRILLYLLLTLAPFAIVGPFIGPALDRVRGGRRMMIVTTLGVRALLMLLLIRNIETFWLFPLAFTQLVTSKSYSVAKAATVPTTVTTEEELVDKNARLAVLGTVAGGVGAAPTLALQAIWGSSVTLGYALVVYLLGVVAATRLPSVVVDDPAVDDHLEEIRTAGVRLAATTMSVLRGITGFVFWLMVFAYGSNDIDLEGIGTAAGAAVRSALGFSIEADNSQPAWKLGFVLSAIGAGIFLGNVIAPRLRERFSEERMIVGAIGAVLVAAIAAIWAGGLSGAMLLALVGGMAPASAKLAFDSLVQRDAPDANHGAAFGRFETRFQIASVIGSVFAVAPTVVIPVRIGALVVAIAALIAGTVYQLGSRGVTLAPLLAQWTERPPAPDRGTPGAESHAPTGPPTEVRAPHRPGSDTTDPVVDPQTIDRQTINPQSLDPLVAPPAHPSPTGQWSAPPTQPVPTAVPSAGAEPAFSKTREEHPSPWWESTPDRPESGSDRRGPEATPRVHDDAPSEHRYEPPSADAVSLEPPFWIEPESSGAVVEGQAVGALDVPSDGGDGQSEVESADVPPATAGDALLPPHWLDEGAEPDPDDEVR